jgi:hypothetical protein
MQNKEDKNQTAQPDNQNLDQEAQLNELNKQPVSEPQELTNNDTQIAATPTPLGESSPPRAAVQVGYQPQKSHKGLLIAAISLAFVALFVGGGFGFWYTGLRTPNTEYSRAAVIVDNLLTNVEEIEGARSATKKMANPGNSVTTVSLRLTDDSDARTVQDSLNKLKNAAQQAIDYKLNQEALAESAVIRNDADIQTVYSVNKKVIDDYGSSVDTYFQTAVIVVTMVDRCLYSSGILDIASIKSATEFDQKMKPCSDYLKKNQSVSVKGFNDAVYVPYRAALMKMVSSTHDLFSNKPGTPAYNQAYKELMEVNEAVSGIDTSKLDTLELAQSPKKQLASLKSKIEQRKNVFFR